jgi:hypothetical protein
VTVTGIKQAGVVPAGIQLPADKAVLMLINNQGRERTLKP